MCVGGVYPPCPVLWVFSVATGKPWPWLLAVDYFSEFVNLFQAIKGLGTKEQPIKYYLVYGKRKRVNVSRESEVFSLVNKVEQGVPKGLGYNKHVVSKK